MKKKTNVKAGVQNTLFEDGDAANTFQADNKVPENTMKKKTKVKAGLKIGPGDFL